MRRLASGTIQLINVDFPTPLLPESNVILPSSRESISEGTLFEGTEVLVDEDARFVSARDIAKH